MNKDIILNNTIATIDVDLVLGELGYLSDYQIKQLNHGLLELLKLR